MGQARAAAAQWVVRHAALAPGFLGAYFTGSTVALADGAALPGSSDIDVRVVTDASAVPRAGKFLYRGALLEVSSGPLPPAEGALGHYHLAAGLAVDTIIADPTGQLRALQAEVARHFAEPEWVRRRLAHALRSSAQALDAIDPAAPWHAQVTAWLFGTGITAHVVLVAALRNPTVRLRYLRAREVVEADLYEEMLALLGCADLTTARAERHLAGLERAFDGAAAALRTPYRFAADLTPAARPVAIDGSRELIRSGFQREAVFWMVATFARCHAVLAVDAPHIPEPGFAAMLADLGIVATGDLMRRAEAVRRMLPRLREAAEAIAAVRWGAGVDGGPGSRPVHRDRPG